MKIISYMLCILAAICKGLIEWIKSADADIVCFQEIKAQVDQIPILEFEALWKIKVYRFPAQKKGYSGVGILTRKQPDRVLYGIEHPLYDFEGRFLRG